jgi:hypothetical protein
MLQKDSAHLGPVEDARETRPTPAKRYALFVSDEQVIVRPVL